MAILSNINGLFAVEDNGAIKFNNLTGTNNQVLIANTGASPTWVDVDYYYRWTIFTTYRWYISWCG